MRRLEGAFHGRRRGRRRLGAEEAYAYPSGGVAEARLEAWKKVFEA